MQNKTDFNQIPLDHDVEGGPHVVPFDQLLLTDSADDPHIQAKMEGTEQSSLNDEQLRAYDIIDQHLQKTLREKCPSQLHMVIPGEGGMGKLHTIQAITDNFVNWKVNNWLAKGAYTGIAASIINGNTLHVLTVMPI